MSRKALSLAIVFAVVAVPAVANAEPPKRIRSPSTLTTDGGSTLRLPPGYFVDEPAWNALDAELKRLQGRETRLQAENESLRSSAAEGGGWGMFVAGILVAAGIGVGGYALTR